MAQRLRIAGMDKRHRALTKPLAGSYSQAARVCLSQHHKSPVEFTLLDNGTESQAHVRWNPPDERTRDAWANKTDTTEAGGYCCVIAAVETVRGLRAIRRAETGTGADYYVGPPGDIHDLESHSRLEVSGVNAGDRRDVLTRLTEKIKQASKGESNRPAIAGVVGFQSKLVMLRDVADDEP